MESRTAWSTWRMPKLSTIRRTHDISIVYEYEIYLVVNHFELDPVWDMLMRLWNSG
jgi:hypothetical protein